MKNNQYVGKLTIALTMVLVSMFAVVTATFAWFNVVNTPEIGNISMGVDEGNEVKFRLAGDLNWRNEITGSEIYGKAGISQSHKFTNVTPDATVNGFVPTFTKLKYTPANSGSNSQGVVSQSAYSSMAAVKNTDYLQVTVEVKADVATELYLYDLFVALEGSHDANDELASKMIRVGFSSSESSEMKIFNPNSLAFSSTAEEKAEIGFGDFYQSANIESDFSKMIGSSYLSSKQTTGLSYSDRGYLVNADGKKVTITVTTPNIAGATLVNEVPSGTDGVTGLGTVRYLANGQAYVHSNEGGSNAWRLIPGITYSTSMVVDSIVAVEATSDLTSKTEAFVYDKEANKLMFRQASLGTDGTVSYNYVEASYSYYNLGVANVYEAINKSYDVKLATLNTDNQAPAVSNSDVATSLVSLNDGNTFTSSFVLTIWFEGWSGYSVDAAELGSFSIGMRFIGDRA